MNLQNVPAFDEPLKVTVVENEVVILGPDGLCASFTVDAARQSAERLMAALDEARSWSPPKD